MPHISAHPRRGQRAAVRYSSPHRRPDRPHVHAFRARRAGDRAANTTSDNKRSALLLKCPCVNVDGDFSVTETPLTPVSRNLGLWLLLLLFGLIFWSIVTKQQPRDTEISFTRFMQAVDADKVANVTIQGKHIRGQYKDEQGHPGESFKTFAPEDATLSPRRRRKA